MFLQSHWHSLCPLLIGGILHWSNFLMNYQVFVFFFLRGKAVLISSSLISNLVSNKLNMVPSIDWVLYQFLFGTSLLVKVSEYELSHFQGIGENIDRQLSAFHYCYVFMVSIVLIWSKSCYNSKSFWQLRVDLKRPHLESFSLSIKEPGIEHLVLSEVTETI